MKATREVSRGRERDMGAAAAHTERTRSPSLKPVASHQNARYPLPTFFGRG